MITAAFAIISAFAYFLGGRDPAFIMTFLANLVICLHQETLLVIEKKDHGCDHA